MMYNPQLDTFLCVVEAGSFSKAAEQLYISAPAVIKQINSLEASLGVKLFGWTMQCEESRMIIHFIRMISTGVIFPTIIHSGI